MNTSKYSFLVSALCIGLSGCTTASTKSISVASYSLQPTDRVVRCAVVAEHTPLSVEQTNQYGGKRTFEMNGIQMSSKFAESIAKAMRRRMIDAIIVSSINEAKSYESIDTMIVVQMVGFKSANAEHSFALVLSRLPANRLVATGDIKTTGGNLINGWETPAEELVDRLMDEKGYLRK